MTRIRSRLERLFFRVNWLDVIAWVIVAWVMVFSIHAHDAPLTRDQFRSQYALAYGEYGSRHGGIPPPRPGPKIEFVTRTRLCQEYGAQPGCLLISMHREGWIFVAEDADFSDAHDSSALIHEYVHWFQFVHRGAIKSRAEWCAREIEALLIQHKALMKARQEAAAAMVRFNARQLACRYGGER